MDMRRLIILHVEDNYEDIHPLNPYLILFMLLY